MCRVSLFVVFFLLVFVFVLVPPGDNDPSPNLVASTMLATMRPSPDVLPRSSTGYMRPRTRPQTKSKSKRKGADEDKPKPSKTTKLPRKNSTPRSASSPRDLALEPAYGLLSDVPQSMLFCFQVAPLPSQLCGADTDSSVVSDPALLHIEKFASTGPEPMFDHSWRIAFVEARIPMEEYGLSRFASDETVCADTDILEERDVPPSMALASVSPISASLSPLAILSSRQDPESPGVDGSPLSLAPSVQLVDTYRSLGCSHENTEQPSHLHPSVLIQSNVSGVADGQASVMSPECYSTLATFPNEPPSNLLHHASGPQHWAPSYTPSFVSPFQPPAHASPVLSSSLAPITSGPSPLTSSDSGSTTYPQSRFSPPPLRGPQLEPVSQPSVPTLLHEDYHRDTMARPFIDLRLPPPPPLTSFPIHQPFPPLGFPLGPWVSGYSVPHYMTKAPSPPVTHPDAFGMPNVFNIPHGQPLSYPGPHPVHAVPISSMPLPVLQPTPCVPTPWCALFDHLKKRSQNDPGLTKKKRRISALTPERLVHDASRPGSNDTGDNEHEKRVHPCPLCPRVFSLPNSLALHLKWHWGASGLEWKRGINPKGRGLERAMREAEERRWRAPTSPMEKLPYETEAGVSIDHPPTTSEFRRAHGAPSPSPIDDGNGVASGNFNPQVSWDAVYNPYCPSSEASTSTSELGESPSLPPFDSGRSFPPPRLPSLGELALPQLPTDTTPGAHPFDSRFISQEGLFHTETGPAHDDALQGGMSNHIMQWSHNWFGYDSLTEQDESPNVAEEREEDLDALLGDPHARIEVSTHRRVDGQRTMQENRVRDAAFDKCVASSVSHYRARSPARPSPCGSTSNYRSVSPGSSMSSITMPVPVHAPWLAPLNLPPSPLASASDSAGNDVLLAALGPLADLIALPSPPALDAFGEPSSLLS